MATDFMKLIVLTIKYLVDTIGIVLDFFNIKLCPFHLESILKKAKKEHVENAKKDKFFMKNLSILLKDLEKVKTISLGGRFLFHNQFCDFMKYKYNLDNYVRDHPEIKNVTIKKPVFIVTLPRTGSTFLHVTMQQDKRWFCPEIWMQNILVPPPSNPLSEQDIKERQYSDKLLSIGKCLWTNQINEAHHMTAASPEDLLMNLSITGIQFYFAMSMDGISDYKEYLLNLDKSDWIKAYESVKIMMQCLMYNYPNERLLTMSHVPFSSVEALLEVFPDAQIVTIHRDPVKSLASITSLLGMTGSHFYVYNSRNLKPMADKVSDMFYRQMTKYLKQREKIRIESKVDNQFIDIHFKDLVKKPLDTFKDLYEKLGMPFDEECENCLTTFINNQKEHKKGKHKYRESIIRKEFYYEKFASYIKEYSVELGL